MTARRLSATALALFALVAAGCGGGGGNQLSKSQYETQVKNITGQVQKDFAGIQGQNSTAEISSAVDKAQQSLNNAASKLAALKPPDDAKADTAAIVAGFRYVASQLPQLKAAVQKKDLAAIQKLQQNLTSAPQVTAARTATADLKKKGYQVGALGQ